MTVERHHGLHELVDEVVILLAHSPGLPQSNVVLGLPELLPVGPHVQHHGECLAGRDVCQGRVESQLAHRYSHALSPQVPQAQDPLPVSHTDGPDLRAGPVTQHRQDVAPVLDGDEETLGSAVDVAELLTGLAHCGSVDQRHEELSVL